MAGELIDRHALERIVKRAAELQAGEREIGDGLTQGEVMALGKDVGIPERYLRQAMLEVGLEGSDDLVDWLCVGFLVLHNNLPRRGA